jgi:hypothetical protein
MRVTLSGCFYFFRVLLRDRRKLQLLTVRFLLMEFQLRAEFRTPEGTTRLSDLVQLSARLTVNDVCQALSCFETIRGHVRASCRLSTNVFSSQNLA